MVHAWRPDGHAHGSTSMTSLRLLAPRCLLPSPLVGAKRRRDSSKALRVILCRVCSGPSLYSRASPPLSLSILQIRNRRLTYNGQARRIFRAIGKHRSKHDVDPYSEAPSAPPADTTSRGEALLLSESGVRRHDDVEIYMVRRNRRSHQ